MGAWGEGLFENDSSADMVGDVIDAEPSEVGALLDAVMAEVLEPDDGYLEVDQVSQGIAAVALLVADRDPTVLVGVADPDELLAVLAAAGVGLDDVRTARAHGVLDRALQGQDNEWHELWDEAGALDEASAPVHRLRTLLPATRT